MANSVLWGIEPGGKYAPPTQVYKATHDGVGNRLPFRYRSFISFSFGGKLIEDFGLIATTSENRLNRKSYANFEDVVETSEAQDGQTYWGSFFKNNELQLNLATDGITARQLDEFKKWFIAGVKRELILMEHPNRAIMARIAEPPQISMLPFSTNDYVKVSGKKYKTQVTLFKGEITLSLTMDDPYWYAKTNLILPTLKGGGANGIINLKEDPEWLKDYFSKRIEKKEGLFIEYKEENNVKTSFFNPTSFEILENDVWALSGEFPILNPSAEDGMGSIIKRLIYPDDIISIYDKVYTLVSSEDQNVLAQDAGDYVKIIHEDNIPHLAMIKDSVLLGGDLGAMTQEDFDDKVFNTTNKTVSGVPPLMGARVNYGYVSLNTIISWEDNQPFSNSEPKYLYYAGTAPSKPILKFTITPTFNNEGYIKSPKNKYTHSTGDYDYISIGNKYFYFTTPNLLTAYNQALDIVKKFKNGQPYEDLLIYLKENVNNYYSRAWAIRCAKLLENNTNCVVNGIVQNPNFFNNFMPEMKKIILNEPDLNVLPFTCEFNSKTGVAKVYYHGIRKATGSEINNYEIKSEEQNAGDMVKSNYLIIDERNYPSYEGYITNKECQLVQTSFGETVDSKELQNLMISFKNMYY